MLDAPGFTPAQREAARNYQRAYAQRRHPRTAAQTAQYAAAAKSKYREHPEYAAARRAYDQQRCRARTPAQKAKYAAAAKRKYQEQKAAGSLPRRPPRTAAQKARENAWARRKYWMNPQQARAAARADYQRRRAYLTRYWKERFERYPELRIISGTTAKELPWLRDSARIVVEARRAVRAQWRKQKQVAVR